VFILSVCVQVRLCLYFVCSSFVCVCFVVTFFDDFLCVFLVFMCDVVLWIVHSGFNVVYMWCECAVCVCGV